MGEKSKKTNDELYNEYTVRKQNLEKQISTIELRQQEILDYISTIDYGVQTLQNLITHEESKSQPDTNKIKSYRSAIAKNIELVTKLYDTNKEYENVKFRYHKEINDSNHNMIKLVEVEIRRLDERVEEQTSSDEFMKMLSVLRDVANKPIEEANNDKEKDETLNEIVKDSKEELISDDKYSL